MFCSWAALSFSFCQLLNVKTHIAAKPSSGLWRPCYKGRWSEERLPLGCCTLCTTHNSVRQLSAPSFPSPRPHPPESWSPDGSAGNVTTVLWRALRKYCQEEKGKRNSSLVHQSKRTVINFTKKMSWTQRRGRLAECCPHGSWRAARFCQGICDLGTSILWLTFYSCYISSQKMWQTEALKIIFEHIFLIKLGPWTCENVPAALWWALLCVWCLQLWSHREISELTFSFEPLMLHWICWRVSTWYWSEKLGIIERKIAQLKGEYGRPGSSVNQVYK